MAVAIAVTRERRDGETRCAVTPETVKKFVSMGATVTVEAGTGTGSSIPDDDYVAAGATVAKDTKAVLAGADIVLKVRGPTAQETSALKPGAVVVDVGVNRVAESNRTRGRLVGDVDFDAVSPLCEAITPVPGGVGPMTVAMLMKNTLDACERAQARG